MDNHLPENDDNLDIAIIGMSGRFPGAANVDEFWHNLCQGTESITFFSTGELLAGGIDPAFLEDPNYVRAAPVIEDVELFDAGFFGYTPNEAEAMDPQHRVFLECAWECFENAGYDPKEFGGAIGVYGGAAMNTYALFSDMGSGIVNNYVSARVGCDKDFLATRVSYKLDLRGPSITVQTSCSTSLVAVHLACQSLLDGECDMALAGGISIQVPHHAGYLYESDGIFSPDGHCRTFDAQANGTNFGSGAGIVLLKRLSDAVSDGDTIQAIVKGSAINNDGASKVGYTAPSISGQASVIAEAIANAGIEAESITYVEAHGTGTLLGDPIEVAALDRAFKSGTTKKQFCAIGSVKTNIGHLDTAAGMAGLIKIVLAMKNKHLPATLNFTSPNPKIDFENSPFYVNDRYRKWETGGRPRRAGITSLGVGGTNAHVILEEAPDSGVRPESAQQQVLTVSARTENAARSMMMNLADYLEAHTNIDLADAAYTLHTGRRRFPYRGYTVCESLKSGVDSLRQARPAIRHCDGRERPVVFMFPGQGAQYPAMAAGLYAEFAEFRTQVDRMCRHLDNLIDIDMKTLLTDAAVAGGDRINQTWLAQPALLVVEYALARLWMSWGIHPEAMVGHSVGEYVCAVLAGVMSVEQALEVVVARGRLMQGAPAGRMLTIALPRKELLPILDGRVSLAAVNAPDSCVVAGPSDAISELKRTIDARGIVHQELRTSHAYHSRMMEPLLKPFAAVLGEVEFSEPQLPWVSTVTAGWIRPNETNCSEYWCRQLRDTVRFHDALEILFDNPDRIFLEVGPGRALQSFVLRSLAHRQASVDAVSSFRPPWQGHGESAQLLDAAGTLWAAGADVDWTTLQGEGSHRRIPLPTYPFERSRYWSITPEKIRELSRPSGSPAPDLADAQSAQSEPRRYRSHGFYFPSWKRVPWPRTETTPRWVLFCEPNGTGQALARRLQEKGFRVIRVHAGSRYDRNADTFTINPSDRSDYLGLFSALREDDPGAGLTIIHLWDRPETGAMTVREGIEQALTTGFHSLIHIAHAIADSGLDDVRIRAVTRGACNVSGTETVNPLDATLQGLCRVIPREFPGTGCLTVDLGHHAAEDFDTDESDTLLNAISIDDAGVGPVALRNGHLWTPLYEAMDVPAEVEDAFRVEGTYLITGGLGGIGLAIAEHLTGEYRARVALLGRSNFPAKEQWDSWIADHGHDDNVTGKIRRLKAMDAGGAKVLVLNGDVTDPDQMQSGVDRVERCFGPINGVIHAAGVINDGAMVLKSREELDSVLAPKILGTLVLFELLKHKPVDFLILMSSLGSILGNFGQSDYSAANCFLDAFAQAHEGISPRVLTINWPAWRSVGMAAERPAGQSPPRDEESIDTDQGIRVMHTATALRVPQVFYSLRPVHSILAAAHTGHLDSSPPSAVESEPDPESDDPAVFITNVWRNVLGIRVMSENDRFADLGGDSLAAIRVVSQIRDKYRIQFTLEEILESGTIAAQAAMVDERQRETEMPARDSNHAELTVTEL
jgi:acyl transferase domain-containing protein/acyl carrier protein